MMRVGNVSANCRTRCWGSPGSSRWGVRASLPTVGQAFAGDEGESELDKQKAAVSVRRWVDKGVRDAPQPPHARSGTGRQVVVGDRRPVGVASNKRMATPAPRSISCWQMRWCAAVSGERSGERRVPEICVHIDYDTMLNGLHEASVCETADGIPLPPETVRRLACEAAIVPIVLNGAGEALNCGRENRVANRAQRRALRAMYRTCGYPGCEVVFDRCDIHHVIEWLRFGSHQSRQSAPTCAATPSSGSRRTLADHPRQTPGHHRPPTRRHPTLPRHHHQPHRPTRPSRGSGDRQRRRSGQRSTATATPETINGRRLVRQVRHEPLDRRDSDERLGLSQSHLAPRPASERGNPPHLPRPLGHGTRSRSGERLVGEMLGDVLSRALVRPTAEVSVAQVDEDLLTIR